MMEEILFGVVVVLSYVASIKLMNYYRAQYKRRIVWQVVNDPELQKEIDKLLGREV